MTTTVRRRLSAPSGLALLWFGMLGGPVAWAARLLVAYPLVPVACATGSNLPLHLVTLATAASTVAAALVSWRIWRQARRDARGDDGGGLSRNGFMGLFGMLSSGFFLLVILAEGSMAFFVDACAWV